MPPDRLKMHQKAFGGRAAKRFLSLAEAKRFGRLLKRSARPPSRNGGPTSKGKEGKGRGKGVPPSYC